MIYHFQFGFYFGHESYMTVCFTLDASFLVPFLTVVC
jgi:hypothetical protein